MQAGELKQCVECRKWRPLRDFNAHPMAADGLHGHCRPCYNEKQRLAVQARPRFEPVTEGHRTCRKCTRVKPASEFLVDRRRRDGRATICRGCNHAAVREIKSRDPNAQRVADRERKAAHRRHPSDEESILATNRTYQYAYVQRNQRYLFAYLLEHPCVDCGEEDPIVLEFDHIKERGPKVGNVSELTYFGGSIDRLLREIAKCEVVCANCHKRRTSQRGNHYRHRLALESAAALDVDTTVTDPLIGPV